jgi:Protein of unknown function (DUF2752)
MPKAVHCVMEASAPSNRKRARLGVALGAGTALAGALTYIGLADPHRPDSVFPRCPFKLLTGWNCPGCGGLRMVHDVLHGDLAAAVVDNAFLLLGLPALALWVLGRRFRGKPVVNAAVIVITLVLTVLWTVLRNLPGFPLVPTILDG